MKRRELIHVGLAGGAAAAVGTSGVVFGLPVNLSFFGRAWSEPVLIKLAYAFEQTVRARRPPGFLNTLSL